MACTIAIGAGLYVVFLGYDHDVVQYAYRAGKFRFFMKVQLEAKSPTANVGFFESDEAAVHDSSVSAKDAFHVLVREVVWDILDKASDVRTFSRYCDVAELESASSDLSSHFDRNVSDVKSSPVETVSNYCLYYIVDGHLELALKFSDDG